jgi:hypothetical protein
MLETRHYGLRSEEGATNSACLAFLLNSTTPPTLSGQRPHQVRHRLRHEETRGVVAFGLAESKGRACWAGRPTSALSVNGPRQRQCSTAPRTTKYSGSELSTTPAVVCAKRSAPLGSYLAAQAPRYEKRQSLRCKYAECDLIKATVCCSR